MYSDSRATVHYYLLTHSPLDKYLLATEVLSVHMHATLVVLRVARSSTSEPFLYTCMTFQPDEASALMHRLTLRTLQCVHARQDKEIKRK